MLAQTTTALLADPTEKATARSLMVEQEAPLSDAPLYSPEAVGVLLLLLLLSPTSPREPRDK